MPSWNPNQYLKFEEERARPCRDLVAQLPLERPSRFVDLGCGPGTSARIVAERYPEAQIIGVDSSAEMIHAAKIAIPHARWITDTIASWAGKQSEHFELLFSNASLQWVENHHQLLPQLFNLLTRGGTLAIQLPADIDAPAHRAMRELATSSKWAASFNNPQGPVRNWHAHESATYYDIFAPLGAKINLWESTYIHVLPSLDAIIEWYKGSGLRPYLDALPSAETQTEFLNDYRVEIAKHYTERPDSKVLFPFRRTFIVASKA